MFFFSDSVLKSQIESPFGVSLYCCVFKCVKSHQPNLFTKTIKNLGFVFFR